MKKKLISLTLSLLLSANLAVPAAAARFSDVPGTHWAYSAIQGAAASGITCGYSDGTFRPGTSVTSAQFGVMLSRAFFPEDVKTAASQAGNASWFSPNLTALAARNITEGTALEQQTAWNTRGGEYVDRYDMAVMMNNIMEASGKTVSAEERAAAQAQIADWNTIPSSKRDAVASVYALGLITGYSDGTFCGSRAMNRAQGCVVINRLADCLAKMNSCPAVTPVPTPETKPETTPETTPEITPETKPETKPETTPETKPETKPETTPETKPETKPETTPAGPTLADGSEMTEANVRALIESLKSQYPEGMRWTNSNRYFSSALRTTGYGCAGFAFLCSDTAFGSLPATGTHSDFNRVRVGDILRVNNDTHSVVVLEKNSDSVTVTEGNFNSSIHWGRTISRSELEWGNFTVTTRWPAGNS